MTYQFKSASTENVEKQVFIALAGTTGSGKTESAMRIATGIVDGKGKFCVIDTEHKRALNKKSRYDFDHLDLQAPYSPENFKGAISAAIEAGYKAIVIDNFSHEWFGEGGCSDIQEEALERMSGGDMRKAERMTAIAWKKPKQEHKKLMYRILQSSTPIIFCLRAEPKIKFQKDANGKTQIVDAGWLPIAEKMFGYEMLIYALMMPENPGVPVQLKKLEPELEVVFPVGKQINEESGKRLAKWAAADLPQQPKLEEVASPEIKKIRELCQQLNKANDSIKWTAGNLTGYIRELFDTTGGIENLDAEQIDILTGDLEGRLETLAVQQEASAAA